jgi:hypothetical protein
MKIVRKNKYPVCEFGELKVGDVFIENCDGQEIIQMKTELVGDGDASCNAVALSGGELYYIEFNTMVRPVAAELVISNT